MQMYIRGISIYLSIIYLSIERTICWGKPPVGQTGQRENIICEALVYTNNLNKSYIKNSQVCVRYSDLSVKT